MLIHTGINMIIWNVIYLICCSLIYIIIMCILMRFFRLSAGLVLNVPHTFWIFLTEYDILNNIQTILEMGVMCLLRICIYKVRAPREKTNESLTLI